MAAIGKSYGSGAVPRLHDRSMELVEGSTLGVHHVVAGPCFGDQHHHGVGQRIAAHDQQFKCVVERGRVGLAFVDQRPDLVKVITKDVRGHRLLTGRHPVGVAAHGVDFTVVGNHAEGVCQIPGWEGVGREALVHQRQRRHDTRILQIGVVSADLIGQQHALVHDGARGHRKNVELTAVVEFAMGNFMFDTLADDKQLALEGILIGGLATNKDLTSNGFLFDGHLGEAFVALRYITPAEEVLAFFVNDSGND